MSTFEIKMPKLGESITEGTIMVWNVKEGDNIQEDEVLFEVNTAKVSAEIPSPVAGKIIKILFNEGDVIPVGTTILLVQLEGESDDTAREETKEIPSGEELRIPARSSTDTILPASAISQKETKIASDHWYSPVVLRIAKERGISNEELNKISGTGYLGRLSKKDLELYVDKKREASPVEIQEKQTETGVRTVPISTTQAVSIPAATTRPTTESGNEEKELDYVGRLIADHMVLSKKTSPHVTTVVEVDVTKLVHWRDQVKEDFLKREGVKLTFMPAIVEATAKALAEFPQVNASLDGYRMILKKHIHIGVAVSLNDGNLIVPVIHDANKLNINGLSLEINTLASKARSGKLALDDIQGGTFTITNFGTFKNIIGTPIINQPQVAILGVGYVEKKPAVIETPEGDVIAIRHKMYLSLSYDHRIINGSMGGAFLKRIADYLEYWNK